MNVSHKKHHGAQIQLFVQKVEKGPHVHVGFASPGCAVCFICDEETAKPFAEDVIAYADKTFEKPAESKPTKAAYTPTVPQELLDKLHEQEADEDE